MTKNQEKYIKQLTQKKFRSQYQQFLVEGEKSVLEVLNSSYTVNQLYVSEKFQSLYAEKLPQNTEVVSQKQLEKVGSLKTNNAAIAVVEIPNTSLLEKVGWVIALDRINDPGNLGTIIRIADWFGIKQIVCSEGSVDCYNPKVISSTKGSFSRVNVVYLDLVNFLKEDEREVYAAEMSGKDISSINFPKNGILLMGSESHGVEPAISDLVDNSITIARVGKAESLNVAVATSIICYQISLVN